VYTYSSATSQCARNGSSTTCPLALPNSFYLTAKPAWFGTLSWPAIGPDVTGGAGAGGKAGLIPAWNCYVNVMGGVEGGTGSPLTTFDPVACYGS
ncbi:MAG TPA: hypothetical protein VEU08_19960, partial [Vicinamibacterales bacterium]|nr:hypothetical protein [Vicinamibacterales bacterium]